MYRPVHAVRVSVWGRVVGVVAPARERGVYSFEYNPSFLRSGIELSPHGVQRRDPHRRRPR